MKDNWKKISALLMALVMMMSMLVACGGGGSSSSEDGGVGEAEEPAAVEPNSGVSGIVFTIPDDWTLTSAGEENIGYSTADKKASFWAGITTEDALKTIKEYKKDVKAESVEEYYEELNSNPENNDELKPIKVGEWDATELKTSNEAGECIALGARWLVDGKMYVMEVVTEDFRDDKGEINKNASAISEDLIETFEGVLASVKTGDGTDMVLSKVDATSIGEFSFETPEGFKLHDYSDTYIYFTKEGSETSISISKTTEEDIKRWAEQEEDAPKTLQEQFNNHLYEGVETATIAGCEGYKNIDNNTYEDGNTYSCDAGFLTDDAIYSMYLSTDAWDENGLKDDAVPLTDEEKEAFRNFVDSIKKK